MGLRVLLLESSNFPRQKVCGEFVSAESLEILRRLLRDVPQADEMFASAPVLARTRLLMGERTIEASVSPAALSIPRYKLDALLWESAKLSGATALSDCQVKGIEGNGPFRLEACGREWLASAVIIASGRWSRFALALDLPPGPKWIGLKAHFRESNPSMSTDLYFFENGYCGVQPIAADAVNACAMVRSDRANSLQQVFALHPSLAERAATWTELTAPVNTAPLLYRTPQPVRNNMMFVGDAAGFIDPFVGDGISIALRSGSLAANCLGEPGSLPDTLERYGREYSTQFAPLLSAAARVRGLLSLPRFARAMAFETLRLPGVMPFVIRKTRTVA
jgi:hypothetical protein